MSDWLDSRMITKGIKAQSGRTADALARYGEKRTGYYKIGKALGKASGDYDPSWFRIGR